jgi:hypothetical protein
MQNYSTLAAFGALNMKELNCIAAEQTYLMIHAPRVPMVSLFLTIINHIIMDTCARIRQIVIHILMRSLTGAL